MTTEGVEVDERSVRAAWRKAQYRDFWVQLRTNEITDDAFGDAINAVNDDEPDHIAFAGLHARSPAGLVVMLGGVVDDAHLHRWLTTFAAHLSARGLTGTLQGARTTSPPRWMSGDATPTPTAFLAWVRDPDLVSSDPDRRGEWQVGPAATTAIAEFAAAWAEPGGNQIVLFDDTFPFAVSDPSSVAPTLRSAALRCGMTAVVHHTHGQRRARYAYLTPVGDTVVQQLDSSMPSQDRIDALRDAITTLPQYLSQAFIRPAVPYSIGWEHIADGQPLPGLHEADIRYNRHLLADYVPDAHGIQVLTDNHLRRARDLSSWHVSDLGGARHLVEARDLGPWYATPLPDDDVVTRARHDFGEMVLTKETIEANPPTLE